MKKEESSSYRLLNIPEHSDIIFSSHSQSALRRADRSEEVFIPGFLPDHIIVICDDIYVLPPHPEYDIKQAAKCLKIKELSDMHFLIIDDYVIQPDKSDMNIYFSYPFEIKLSGISEQTFSYFIDKTDTLRVPDNTDIERILDMCDINMTEQLEMDRNDHKLVKCSIMMKTLQKDSFQDLLALIADDTSGISEYSVDWNEDFNSDKVSFLDFVSEQ